MDKYAILLGYFDKQLELIGRLQSEIVKLDVAVWEQGYVFALKTQQFFTAIEDLLKQIAKAFENHIEDLSQYHRGLLMRLNTEVPGIRPRVLSDQSFRFLDQVRAFRHFIRHGYGCELDPKQLEHMLSLVSAEYSTTLDDFRAFRAYVAKLAES